MAMKENDARLGCEVVARVWLRKRLELELVFRVSEISRQYAAKLLYPVRTAEDVSLVF